DPATGQARHTLTRHTREVRSCAIAPNGSWLVTTSWDQTAIIWDPATGPARHTLTGHTPLVGPSSVPPDGSRVFPPTPTATPTLPPPPPRLPPPHPDPPHTRGALLCHSPGRQLAGHHQRRPDRDHLGSSHRRHIYSATCQQTHHPLCLAARLQWCCLHSRTQH